ncbi:MAG TPA: type II secretion system F family protein [Mycobacteriales bacterium]|nr:type II secretion system F family protein [Mycobacteriales bacterium]
MTALAALALAAAVLLRRPPAAHRLVRDATGGPPAHVVGPLGVAGLLVMAVGSWRWIAVATIGAAAGRHLVRRRTDAALARARSADATTLAYALAAELRAGRPPGIALAAVAPHLRVLAADVAAAGRAVSRGADLGTELDHLVAASGCARLQPLAAALGTTAGAGVAVADLLDRIGRAFDADDEITAELSAAAAGPRSTVAVLIGLPVFGLVIGSAIGAAPLHVLLHERAGVLLFLAAALLDLVGWWWVRAILRRAMPG